MDELRVAQRFNHLVGDNCEWARRVGLFEEAANQLDPEDRNRLVIFLTVNRMVVEKMKKTFTHPRGGFWNCQAREIQIGQCHRQVRAMGEF